MSNPLIMREILALVPEALRLLPALIRAIAAGDHDLAQRKAEEAARRQAFVRARKERDKL
jgi:hypothetical protein